MKIIGVTGQLANGKDVFCDHLAQCLNKKSHKIIWDRGAFANAVKDTFCQAFGVDKNFIEKWKRIPEAPSGFLMPIRQCLQFIGDGYRKIRSEIWIEIALRDNGKNLIISDGRYVNEAKAIKERGGIMFLLYRSGFLNDDPNPSESQIRPLVDWCNKNLKEGPIDYADLMMRYGVDCPSELQYYDYFVKNDGTVEDFYQKISESISPFILESYWYSNSNSCNNE